MRSQTAGYVLAGVDGGPGDEKVLAWATGEAGRRGIDCMLAYGRPEREGPEDLSVITAAADRARAMAPGVPVLTRTAMRDPADVLAELGARAEVTVVGAGEPRHRLGPVAAHLLDRATGPVVLIRGRVNSRTRIVAVGVDGSPAAEEACAFAVEEARLNQVRLIVAASYWRAEPADSAVHLSAAGTDVRRTTTEQMVAELTGPYERKYPGLTITPMLSALPPEEFLTGVAADQTDLLVVGNRGHGRLGRMVLGSVSRHLARHAWCPIAVVRARPEGES